MIVKARQLAGFDAAYIPGWDCHGLPIENQIEKTFGRGLPRDEVQAKSRAYAAEQIDGQRADFKRLGVLGEWDNPYRTMNFANEAGEIRVLKRMFERGFVYRGLKPVYWCFDCGSSLAEFEIEYADKQSPAVDVAFLSAEPQKLAAAFGLAPLGKEVFTVIWTTTPWTIPANQALNLNPDLPYALVDTPKGFFVVAQALVEKCLARWQLEGSVVATTPGRSLELLKFKHPLAHVDPGYNRESPVYLADYATAEDGTGGRPFLARLWPGRLPVLRRTRLGLRRHPEPGPGQRHLRGRSAAVRRPAHLEGQRGRRPDAAGRRPADGARQADAQLPALLAPQVARHLPRRCPVVRAQWTTRNQATRVSSRQTRRPTACARRRWPPSRRQASIPRTAAPGCTT